MNAPSALEHCLLGLIEHKQCSGYDLRKILTKTPMRHFSDSPGSIYPALQRIERRGWASRVRDTASQRRRTVYRLTATGKKELRKWLGQTVNAEQISQRRDEVMLRLSFRNLLGEGADIRGFLSEIRDAARSCGKQLLSFIATSTTGYPPGAALALGSGLDSYISLEKWAARELKTFNDPQSARLTGSLEL